MSEIFDAREPEYLRPEDNVVDGFCGVTLQRHQAPSSGAAG